MRTSTRPSDFLDFATHIAETFDSISALLENRSDKLPPIEIVVTNPGARVIYDALKPPDGVPLVVTNDSSLHGNDHQS